MKNIYIISILLIFLFGCSENDNDAIKPPAQEKENVFDAQMEAIDKATSVDQQIMDAAEKQRQVIEEQSG